MKKAALALLAFTVAAPAIAQSGTYVKPHVRKDGTYVPGHYRSAPNSTTLDNYSTKGNTNPYTGKQGTEDPYKPKTKASCTYFCPND